MSLRLLFLLGAIAVASPACVVYATEPGAVTSDGSVYLGFDLYSGKGKSDRESYPVGQQLGAFSTIWLTADEPVAVQQVLVVFADGERYNAPVPATLGGHRSSPAIRLPRGPRQIHSIVVGAKSQNKHLAKIEIYGRH